MIERDEVYGQSRPQLGKLEVNLGYLAVETDAAAGRLLADALPELSGTAETVIPVMDGKADLIVGADVTGLWHYSSSRIDQFSAEIAEGTDGKFGHGTYFGIGDLKGETVDGLLAGGYERHDIRFRGNILAVDRSSVMDLANALKATQGLPVSRMRSTANTAPLSDLATVQFEGQTIDGVMVYMDEDRGSAELVVKPSSTGNIKLI